MTDLLVQFANPQAMQAMSTGDKLFAGLFTTVLGMGITFLALIILQFIISWMDRLINAKKEVIAPSTPQVQVRPSSQKVTSTVDDKEIVAAISTSLAIMLGTSVDKIVIKNIVKVEDRSPIWNRTGILEQMNSRL
jgi:sodium pump decarboxylase gamma subunit